MLRIFITVTILIALAGCATKTKYIVEPVVIDNCSDNIETKIILPPKPECGIISKLPNVRWEHVKEAPYIYIIRSSYLSTLANNIDSLLDCIQTYKDYTDTVETIINGSIQRD